MTLGRAGILVIVLLNATLAFGQGNGKLQVHFMDVGQGDGTMLISPDGEVVLFDHGVLNRCGLVLSYLERLALTKIDYLISSHYHSDHIGCTEEILRRYPLLNRAFDRGGAYSSATFNRYVMAVDAQRTTATENGTLTLDATSADPVQITFVALNGDGLPTQDENSLSLVSVVRYGQFTAEISGDLTGTRVGAAVDVETQVGPRVGSLDVYKVHHHCSRYSTNENWLLATTPTVAIVSAGDGNTYGHPTPDCLTRLHSVNAKAYWTEFGSGAAVPDPAFDVVAGAIVIETLADPVVQTFTVSYTGGLSDTYMVRPR
jgi:beta-lactamase superfamily II metal-dependent hydrolase